MGRSTGGHPPAMCIGSCSAAQNIQNTVRGASARGRAGSGAAALNRARFRHGRAGPGLGSRLEFGLIVARGIRFRFGGLSRCQTQVQQLPKLKFTRSSWCSEVQQASKLSSRRFSRRRGSGSAGSAVSWFLFSRGSGSDDGGV
eukprot:gene9435-biopygen6439